MRKVLHSVYILLFIWMSFHQPVSAQEKKKTTSTERKVPKINPNVSPPIKVKVNTDELGGGEGFGNGNPTYDCIAANAGANHTICPNGSVQIGGNSYSPNYTYSWSPSTGLSSASIPNPTASPTQTTTYTLTMTPKVNLISNGSFENGNVNVNSDYGYVPDANLVGLGPDGYYLGNRGWEVYGHWCNIPPPDGNNIMIVDGDIEDDYHNDFSFRVWYQNVAISPNTTYTFSGMFMNLLEGYANNPSILIKINGTAISNIPQLIYNGCQWTTVNALWQSGANDYNALIEIYDRPTLKYTDAGNDFAIDNLSLVSNTCPMTTSSTTVTVNTTPIIAQASPVEWCFVYDEIKPLTLSASPGNSWQWYKDGNAISGANQSTCTQEYSTWGIPSTNPRTFVYTVGNECGISDPVTVVAKATSGKSGQIYYLNSYPNAPTCILWSIPTSNYFWDPNYSLQYSVTSPGQITSTNSGGNLDLTMCIPASFPTTVTFTLSTTEFGCVTPWNAHVTFDGNLGQVPTIVFNSKKPPFFTVKPDVSTNLNEKDILIYPNPAKNNFTISAIDEFQKIQIFSSKGALVKTINKKGRTASVDASGLLPGTYFVNILDSKGNKTRKLIVVK